MRAYTVADVFAVAALFKAAIGNGSKLSGLMKAGASGGSGGVEGDEAEAAPGLALVTYLVGECLANCQELLVNWFASLNGVTPEEFRAKPPDALLNTVEEIVDNPESKTFFSNASRLYKKIPASGITTGSD